ncbi:uncharacterized protein LOC110855496 [Folsomia candida]|uniref:uncharacterized protein LOC110855496 n=1 Tax=Folsomia candida TaxID=158441 RepID=UPI0016052A36|nr:uncharacterized protein LOC110855496 [Folsomia candida]
MIFKISKPEIILICALIINTFRDTKGWMADLPAWIEKVDKEIFDLPLEAENISISNHSGIVVCLFHLVSRYSPPRPGVSGSTFVPSENFDGSLCTHVICTRIHISHDLLIYESNEFHALPMVKHLREKYPSTNFLLDVTVWPSDPAQYVQNKTSFVDRVKNILRDNGFQGVHLNQAFSGEDHTPSKAQYRALVKALKTDFAQENLILTSDLVMQDGKISDIHEMFDLVMVNPFGRNYDTMTSFFFTPANYLDGKGIRAGGKSNFVLQVYMFGFMGEFSTLDGGVTRKFENDFWDYNELCQIVENNGMELLWDSKAGMAILTNGTVGVLTPTPKSVMATVDFAMNAGLSGVMMTSTPEDDFTPYCGRVKYPLSKSANLAMTRATSRVVRNQTVSEELPLSLPTKYIPILIAGMIMLTILGAIGVKKMKNIRRSTTIRLLEDIQLSPFIPSDLASVLLPPLQNILPLPSPWRSDSSLVCYSILGKGSYGAVYRAEDLAAISHTEYAIKCVDIIKTLSECDESHTNSTSSSPFPSERSIYLKKYVTTLLNEIEIMDQLTCDHVVRSYGCWAEAENSSQLVLNKPRLERFIRRLIATASASSTQDSPLIFIKMELCHTNLKTYLEKWSQPGDEVSILRQVAAGLRYVHEKFFIHRDLKPGNIFCKIEPTGSLKWKIGDFGLAVVSKETGNAEVAGTYLYQSPEMRNKLEYKVNTDCYSLGLIGVEVVHEERKSFERFVVFGKLRGLSGVERRNYLNKCCRGRFTTLVKIIDKLLNVDVTKRPCSARLCDMLNKNVDI